MFGTPLYWRETHKQPRFLIFDGRMIVLLLIVILHIRLWTVALAVIMMMVLAFFDRKGVPADSILRFLRASIVGRKRSARGFLAARQAVDFGFETKAAVARAAASHEAMARARSRRNEQSGKKKPGLMARLGLQNG